MEDLYSLKLCRGLFCEVFRAALKGRGFVWGGFAVIHHAGVYFGIFRAKYAWVSSLEILILTQRIYFRRFPAYTRVSFWKITPLQQGFILGNL